MNGSQFHWKPHLVQVLHKVNRLCHCRWLFSILKYFNNYWRIGNSRQQWQRRLKYYVVIIRHSDMHDWDALSSSATMNYIALSGIFSFRFIIISKCKVEIAIELEHWKKRVFIASNSSDSSILNIVRIDVSILGPRGNWGNTFSYQAYSNFWKCQ